MGLKLEGSKWFFDQLSGPDHRGCMEWTKSRRANGYGQIRVGSKTLSTHRLSYFLAFGDIPDGKVIMHSCDNRACCNPMHLSCGTHKENAMDMMKKGRGRGQAKPGGISNNRKLSPEEKVEVRQMLSKRIKGRTIAAKFGVTESLISKIKHGKA